MKHYLAVLLISVASLFASNQAMCAQFKALVFADATDKWHHANVPIAKESFLSLSKQHFFELTWVESDAAFAQQTFSDYDVIVFISANPCELTSLKRKEFQAYVQAGGGIVGVHGAAATNQEPNRWPWWEALLGRVFLDHPIPQSAIISVTDSKFPACLHMDERFLWTDEWYEFEKPMPEHLQVALTVDESTYQPTEKHAMGDEHPVAWYHQKDGQRVFYTSLGHFAESYRDTDFIKHIYGGMFWAVGERTPEW